MSTSLEDCQQTEEKTYMICRVITCTVDLTVTYLKLSTDAFYERRLRSYFPYEYFILANKKPVDPTVRIVFTSSFSGGNNSAKYKLVGRVTMSEAYRITANSKTEHKAISVSRMTQEIDLEDISPV